MHYRSVSTVLIILAILIIIAIAGRLFEYHYFHTRSVFATVLFTSLVSGLASQIITEKMNAKVLV